MAKFRDFLQVSPWEMPEECYSHLGRSANFKGGGKGGGGDGGAAAREAARQKQIRSNLGNIDSIFGQYDDDYYNRVYDDTVSYYTPQLEDQYQSAKKAATLSLAKQGVLSSDAGAEALRKIEQTYKNGQTNVANMGLSAKQDAKSGVERERSTLSQLAQNGSSLSMDAIRAGADAAQWAQPSSGLGDLFGGLLSNIQGAGSGYLSGRQAAPDAKSLWFSDPTQTGGFKTVG